jgi:hypothetical protein
MAYCQSCADLRRRLKETIELIIEAKDRLLAANERERKLREALAEVRMHLVSEQLPGAHRTGIPLSICDDVLAETQGGEPAK